MSKLGLVRYPDLINMLDMEVIEQGYTSDLHFDTDGVRLWLHRTGLADGEPYENAISVEVLVAGAEETSHSSEWLSIGTYDGDNPPKRLKGFSFDDLFTLHNKPSVQSLKITLNDVYVSYEAIVFIDGTIALKPNLVADQLGFLNWYE